jgi:hypothetical protein
MNPDPLFPTVSFPNPEEKGVSDCRTASLSLLFIVLEERCCFCSLCESLDDIRLVC